VTLGGGIFSCNPDELGCGTVFSVAMGLDPFIDTRPNSGKIGNRVVIFGNDLTGTTSVEFNGTAVKFAVVSDTEIKTEVPDGATTGFVTVATPDGTIKSKVAFVVR